MSTSSSCVAKSTTARKMFSFAASLIPTMFSATRTTITAAPPMMSHGFVLQRLPEDRQVVRDEERRDGDRDDVVEHLRPGGPERDELVEGVAGEARRAAGLRVADRALGVGRRRRGEDQPADQEDERRQPERDRRGDAERVVDRRADVAVRGREERRRPEHALEPLLLPPTPGGTGELYCRSLKTTLRCGARAPHPASPTALAAAPAMSGAATSSRCHARPFG